MFVLQYTTLLKRVSADRYDRDASRYHQGVYKRKRADLVGVLDSTLSPLFLGQLKNLHKSCLATYKKEMLEGMRGEGYNFADVVAAARERLEKRFHPTRFAAAEAFKEGSLLLWDQLTELEALPSLRLTYDLFRLAMKSERAKEFHQLHLSG